MLEQQAIILIHQSSFVPSYLLRTLESARIFNPTIPIYLLSNFFSSSYRTFSVTHVHLDQLECEKEKAFSFLYQHQSPNQEKHERFCFSRWFYLNHFLKKHPFKQVLHLDSDCMLFVNIKGLFPKFEQAKLSASRGQSPHFSFVTGNLDPFTDLILERFSQKNFFDYLKNHQLILSDMTLIEEYIHKKKQGLDYSTLSLGGVIDHSISESEGFAMRYGRKRIFWKHDRGLRLPYLKNLSTNSFEKAFCLHYQGGPNKRWSSRFNRINQTTWPLWIRKAIAPPVTGFYNLFQSHRLKPY